MKNLSGFLVFTPCRLLLSEIFDDVKEEYKMGASSSLRRPYQRDLQETDHLGPTFLQL